MLGRGAAQEGRGKENEEKEDGGEELRHVVVFSDAGLEIQNSRYKVNRPVGNLSCESFAFLALESLAFFEEEGFHGGYLLRVSTGCCFPAHRFYSEATLFAMRC